MYQWNKCNNCDDSYKTIINKLNHDYELIKTVDATCTVNGYKEYKCNNCEDSYKTTITKLNHDYSEKIITPVSCTTDGLKELTCNREHCKDHKTEIIKSNGHDYKLLNTVAPICGTDGYKEYQCSKCKNTYKETLTKLTHNYKLIKTVNATCSVDGYKEYECSNCKDAYRETINKTNVHDYDMTKEINRVESTCKTNGYIEYKCKNCENLYKKTLEIDSSKHDYEETKTDLMYKYSTCKHCEDEIKEYNDVEYEIDMGNGKTKTIVGHYDLEMAVEIGRLVNELRTNYDVAPAMDLLGTDTKLGQAALIRAREIAVLGSHTRPNGTNVLNSMGIEYGIIGENYTKGSKSAQEAVNTWKESPTHAMAQINDKYKNLAVSVFALKTGYDEQPYTYNFIELFQ